MKKRSLFILLLVVLVVLPCAIASAASYHYVYGTSWLKLRQLPSTSSMVLASYRKDYAIISYKQYNSSWAYIFFSDGHEGYVQSKYVKAGKSYTAYIKTDNTILRSGPARTFNNLATLPKGERLTVLCEGSQWCYVNSPNYGVGYINKNYLSKKVVKGPRTIVVPYEAYVINVNNRTVNVRAGAGTNYQVLEELYPGTPVTVTEAGATWCYITCDSPSVSGYMMTKFLSRTSPAETPGPSPAPTFEPTPSPQPFGRYTAYITSENGKSVNLRRGPGTGYATIKSLAVGTSVTVVEWTNKNWSRVLAGNVYGYVMSKYLTTTDPGSGEAATLTGYILASDGETVNVRNGAGSSYGVIMRLYSGTQVTVINDSTNPNWTHIQYGNASGYVMTKYITYTDPGSGGAGTGRADEEAPLTSGFPYKAYITSTNGSPVNVRNGAGTGYSLAGSLSVGTEVTVTSVTGAWLYVQTDTVKGYVHMNYISRSYVAPIAGPEQEESTPEGAEPGGTRAVVATPDGNPVNMRRGPGLGYSHIARLENGTSVLIVGTSGQWSKVYYNQMYGYIMTKYLSY